MMVYEDTAERHRFDSFCKVVLRHAMLDCFREFSYQNKWLVSLNYVPQSRLWTESARQISIPAST